MQVPVKITRLLVIAVIALVSACSHTDAPVAEAAGETEQIHAFKIVIDEKSEQGKTLNEMQRTFIEVKADGKITTSGERLLGELIDPFSIAKEGKLKFRLKENGTIENARGQVLDAQIAGDTLEFKAFVNNARMSISIEDEQLFVNVQAPDGQTKKRSVGRIIPYRKDRNARVLWLAHYSLLQSFELFGCQSKQALAKTTLMLVRQHQESFRSENERYGRSLTEIAFVRNNKHYNIELITSDEAHYIAKATSVPKDDANNEMLSREDEWTIDQDGKIENTNNACR